MKLVTSILAVLLIAVLGAGAYFYIYIHTPVKTEFTKMNQGMPEFEKAKADLKKFRDREIRESGWIPATVETLQSALKDEIAAGKAEVTAVGNAVVVNIAEQALYTPGSRTFSADTTTRTKLPSLLKAKGLEDKEIIIGNMTPSAPAQGKGRKRTPAKEGRALAGERSAELVKYLEKNGVSAQTLVAASWPPNPADRGFKIKDRKTMIIIKYQPAPAQEPAAPKPQAAAPAAPQQPKPAAVPAPPSQPAQPAAPPKPQPVRPQPIPVQPAPPK